MKRILFSNTRIWIVRIKEIRTMILIQKTY